MEPKIASPVPSLGLGFFTCRYADIAGVREHTCHPSTLEVEARKISSWRPVWSIQQGTVAEYRQSQRWVGGSMLVTHAWGPKLNF